MIVEAQPASIRFSLSCRKARLKSGQGSTKVVEVAREDKPRIKVRTKPRVKTKARTRAEVKVKDSDGVETRTRRERGRKRLMRIEG